MRSVLLACVLSAAIAAQASAITWTEAERADPFAEGAACVAFEPMSSGGYIYQYPSKFDLVFWPFIDPNWVWYCPESGYVSFGSEFDTLSDGERERIGTLLAERRALWGDLADTSARIDALEEIYRARDDIDWSWLHRVLAQWRLDETARADAHRAAAVPLLQIKLASVSGAEAMEVVHLLGVYAHRLGQEGAAEAYFEQVRTLVWFDEAGERQRGVPYLEEIIEEVEAGALDEHWGVRKPQ